MASQDILSRTPPPADSRLTYGPDPNHFVDVRIPAGGGPHPVVFFIHGGYWRSQYDLAYAGHLCHALQAAGIATWNVEYRRVGNPGGGWPGTFEDIRVAFRALQQSHEKSPHLSFDMKRLCVAGHSAGAQLALCLAAHEPSISRALALAGVLDLRQAWDLHLSHDAVSAFLGGSPSQVPEHYREASPIEMPIAATQKLIHGEVDDSVPYAISRDYAKRKSASGESVDLMTLQHEGHFEIVDPQSDAWSKVQEAFVALMHV